MLGTPIDGVVSVFPARAGMSRLRRECACVSLCFPRPRGDEPVKPTHSPTALTFSPPARG